MSRKKSNFHKNLKNGGGGTTEAARLFNHYKNIATNLYRWENLPVGIESRHIEEALFNKGQVFFTELEDKTLGFSGFVALPCSSAGSINFYGDPTRFQMTGHGFCRFVEADEGVRILNNDSATPTIFHILHYVERMEQIDSIIQQNLKQQRFPYIVATTRHNEFTMKNIMRDIENGEEAIFLDKTLTEEGKLGVQAIQTNTPYLVDRLTQYRNELEKELLTFLGLNSTIQKKERLLVDETNANNSQIEMNLDLGYKQRELACSLINEKFGLNVEVHKTLDIIDPVLTSSLDSFGGGEPEDVE